MIMLVDVCAEELHSYQYVLPVKNIVGECFVRKYKDVTEADLKKAKKVIICGTAILDNEYLSNIESFSWIKDYDGHILGICAGCQVLQMVFGAKRERGVEIGKKKILFSDSFLGVLGEIWAYLLHQNIVESDKFEVFAKSDSFNCAFKYKDKDFYGVLFHPEVYNKEMIENFCLLEK